MTTSHNSPAALEVRGLDGPFAGPPSPVAWAQRHGSPRLLLWRRDRGGPPLLSSKAEAIVRGRTSDRSDAWCPTLSISATYGGRGFSGLRVQPKVVLRVTQPAAQWAGV